MLIYLYRGKCTATCGHGSSMASPLAISILEAPLKWGRLPNNLVFFYKKKEKEKWGGLFMRWNPSLWL